MKMFVNLFTLVIFSFLAVSGCIVGFNCISGSGNAITDTRDVEEFDKIIIKGSGNVYFRQSENQELRIEADDNLMDYIVTKVNGKTLILSSKESICPKKLNFYISAKDLEGVKIKGSGNFKSEGSIKSSQFAAVIEGSGDMNIDLETKSLKCEIYGSGNIVMSGTADYSVNIIKGSGDIKAKELPVKISKIDIYGSGNTSITVKEDLKVNIFGSGNVYYWGNPPRTLENIKGSGSVLSRK